MDDETAFTIEITPVDGYEFRVKFDWDTVAPLTLDEAAPLGQQHGPNASRLLAAAVANCLTASLLFCLRKSRAEPIGLSTRVRGRLARNPQGRMRIGNLEVTIALDTDPDSRARLDRCAGLFEDYCIVTESVRHGIPVNVRIVDGSGALLFER